jgi:hypothetical protein
MQRAYAGVAMILGLAASSTAMAGGAFTGRVGATAGTYSFDDKYVDTGGFFGPAGAAYTSEDNTGQFGVLAGTGLSVGRFFTDVGIEALKYSREFDTDGDGEDDTAFYRTDFLLTLGAFIGDRWTVFGGYRHATFGDGFFSEDLGSTENGPFLGGGVSFRAGKALSMGVSAAYNMLTLSQDGQNFEDLDLGGFSVKGQMSFLGTPHAIFLRWQRFDGDEAEAGIYEYEYTEDYLNVGYQATFDFKSW